MASELRFGGAKRGSAKLSTQVEAIISAMEIMPLKTHSDTEYANLRLYLEKMGSPIGPNDMLIAAQALAAKSVLVTANKDEFERVPNLIVQNWLI